ncbi:MAG: UvrD-helicase domain-containing protein [Treponemataceae bacterium]|nr:UvrD-helicase domain-containing protein [Treponemataceae bacterium]
MADRKYKYLDEVLEIDGHALDDQQYQVCTTIDENMVVAAGAGSGKTQVLASRFAFLIMEDESITDPSQILTLTFTNKAASEMYQRIYQILGKFADNLDDNHKIQRERAKKALENFGGVHIQTLDSYCAQLVRQAANRYGINPKFTAGSKETDISVKSRAFEFLMQHKDDECIKKLVDTSELQKFAEDIFAEIVLEHSDLTSPEIYFSSPEFLQKQRNEIAKAWNYFALGNDHKFVAYTEANNDLYRLPSILDTFPQKPGSSNKNEFEKLEELKSAYNSLIFPMSENPDQEEMEKILDCKPHVDKFINLIGSFSGGQKFCGENGGKDKAIFTLFKGTSEMLTSKEYLLSIFSYIENYGYLKSLYELLDEFKNQINQMKRISGNLSFRDISELALDILKNQKDIRSQEKAAYKKIMIDEFQDNNDKNKQLLFYISEQKDICNDSVLAENLEKGKLFFVGDEKQSIYKFRGAEVSVFNLLKEELKNQNQTLMTNNYRSKSSLLASFNLLSKKIFEQTSSVRENPSYEAFFNKENEATSTIEEIPEINKDNIRMHCCLLSSQEMEKYKKTNEYLSTSEQTAFFIANKISNLATDSDYSKYAILVKSRTNYDEITKWLRNFKIPYSEDQFDDVFADGPSNDIYNFLRLCVYPQDMTAKAAYLTSPFSGLSQYACREILIRESDSKELESVLGDEYPKYLAARDFFNNNRERFLRQNIADSVSELWYKTGYYHEVLLSNETAIFNESHDYLFELARLVDQEGKGLGYFIDQLAIERNNFRNKKADLNTKEFNYPLEKENAVKILTIHKSKGLEYDCVFVLGVLNHSNKKESSSFDFSQEEGLSFTINGLNFFRLRDLLENRRLEIAEFRRLVYVAYTRAKKHVYFVGPIKAHKEDSNMDFNLIEKVIFNNEEVTEKIEEFDHEAVDNESGKPLYPEKYEVAFPYQEGMPFDVSMIVPQTNSEAYKNAEKINFRKLKDEKLEFLAPIYKNAKIEEFTPAKLKKTSPSKLEVKIEKIGPEAPLFPELKEYIHNDSASSDSEKQEGSVTEENQDFIKDSEFMANDFGTLVHKCLELYCQDENTDFDLNPEIQECCKKIEGKSKAKKAILEICHKMCENFSQSEPYARLKSSSNFGMEYEFKMKLNSYILTGSIDLFYQNPDGSYTIIDYKSDSNMNPEKYYNQQFCYRHALAALENIDEDKIKCQLYFLRFPQDKALVDISEMVSKKEKQLSDQEIEKLLSLNEK